MNVHNIMEDVVSLHVNKMYEELKKNNISWLTCDCENCRLDTTSYVLNHVPPKYVVSGRGVNHSASVLNDAQLKADIEAIALEGIRIVSGTKRPFHSENNSVINSNCPSYNFPIISGNVLDGSNFEPITNAQVELKLDGKLVQMMDKSWQNPFITCQSTKGSFNFWIKPLSAEKVEESKKFIFNVEVSAEGYEKSNVYVEVPVTSEEGPRNELNSTYSIKLKDIVLFKND